MSLSPTEEEIFATLRELVTVALARPGEVEIPDYMAEVMTDEMTPVFGIAVNMISSMVTGWAEAVGVLPADLWRHLLMKGATQS